jgi:hypothetical protein
MRSCTLRELLIAGHFLSAPNSDAANYAKFYSRSHDAVIRVYERSSSVIKTYEQADEFKEW